MEETLVKEARATLKFARISSRKVKIVADLIRGKDVDEALAIMKFTPKASSEVLEKLFEEKYENHDKDFEKLIKTYTSYRDDTPLKDVILRIYTYIESNPFPLKWLKEQVEKFNIKDVKQDFSNTEWGKILLQNMKEELEDCIKKLQAEEKRLSFESELEQYERIILSDIQQLEESCKCCKGYFGFLGRSHLYLYKS